MICWDWELYSTVLTQFAEAVATVFVGFKLLSRWLGGWVAGLNGNNANVSPAEAGVGLSLAKKIFCSTNVLCQVQATFLQWIPWLLRMSRPGEKITKKTIMMAQKMKDLDMKETSSKSLLTNVLDMDDDFRATTLPHNLPQHHPSHVTSHQNPGFVRSVCSRLGFQVFTSVDLFLFRTELTGSVLFSF